MSTDDERVFDGVRVGRPAATALTAAGHRRLADLPDDLAELGDLHGVGPRALELLASSRDREA